MSKDSIVLGFDLGGTKMLCAVFRGKEIISRYKQETGAQEGPDAVVDRMVETIEKTAEDAGVGLSEIQGMGIAVPGPIDRNNGIMVRTPNLGFYDYPLVKKLKKKFNSHIQIENDVSSGTYGELIQGAAVGYRHVIGAFPGTGIGGGIIVDGKLYRGASGNAGEIGHMIIQLNGPLCGCGQHGCLEALASKTALAKDAVALAAAGKAPTILDEAGTDFAKCKSKVFKKAMGDDPAVTSIIKRGAELLGIGLANLVNIFNPELIVLGGGLVEKLGKEYTGIAESTMRAYAMEGISRDVQVVQAKLGDDAVVIGAAGVIWEDLGLWDEQEG
jgi:glucokinase